MTRFSSIAALVFGALIVAAFPAKGAETANVNDMARFIAGMPPASDSPFAALTRDSGWKQHEQALDRAFADLDKRQMSKIRDWSAAHVTPVQPTLFYMFSGPDYLYANAFFPKASTYVLAGLEPVGPVPELTHLSRHALVGSLGHLRASMNTLLSISFFITKQMREDFEASALRGTLPILCVFLARTGASLKDITLVNLDADGTVRNETQPPQKSQARGVKIAFTAADGTPRTLYYFSTNIANDGLPGSGFLKFMETLGPADAMVKSASYLMHSGSFSKIRDFLLERSNGILQDDSGIPLQYFAKGQWDLHPYGAYVGPIAIFPGTYQKNMRALFHDKKVPTIDFGYGYRWRKGESNLLWAVKHAPPAPPPAPKPEVKAPEVKTPEAKAPEAAAPAATAPAPAAPEVKTPESPAAKAPEAATPEAKTPDKATPPAVPQPDATPPAAPSTGDQSSKP